MVSGGPKEKMVPPTASAGACAKSNAKQKQKHKGPKKPRPKPATKKKLEVEVKKTERKVKRLAKKTAGPKMSDQMSTSVTLGVLQGQSQEGLSRQIRMPLNPLLAKASNGGSTTPLSIRGSMYEMWKVLYAEVVATPLSGASNVVGSVGFMSLTLNGLEAGADSIDTIKAKRHIQLTLGRSGRLRLPARELEGPREGWWLIDTSASPADAYGPAIDFCVAYQTRNLLQTNGDNAYTGPLWQLELRVKYGFACYHPKPGLQTLVSETLSEPANVTVTTGADGALVMKTNNPLLLRLLTPRASGQTGGKSQTIWAVAGAAVEAAANVLGPWGWLLKGGFFLVRKIFGAAGRDTETSFQIYPSIQQAMEDQPIYGGSGSSTVSIPVVHVSEVMNPNPEANPTQGSTYGGELPPAAETPFRPMSQPKPLPNGSALDQGFAFVGNFQMFTKWQASGMWIGVTTKYENWSFAAAAPFTENVVQLVSRQNPLGAVGTIQTWADAVRADWGNALAWFPQRTVKVEGSTLECPPEFKTKLGLSDTTQQILCANLYSWEPETQAQPEEKNQLGRQCVLLLGQRTGGGIVFSNKATSQQPTNTDFLQKAVIVTSIPAMKLSSIQTASVLEVVDDDFGDDISLADSFMAECVDPLEEERNRILNRLREIDNCRFHTG
uniref:Structural protein n=1 Tax=Avastrovirus 2 TaxID=1239438 RepID=A0A3G1RP55_9VIRU|nr:MAG: structural protein [Avastrovirus 2]